MSSVETEQMSSVATGHMSAAETGQMSAAETGQISVVAHRQMLKSQIRVLLELKWSKLVQKCRQVSRIHPNESYGHFQAFGTSLEAQNPPNGSEPPKSGRRALRFDSSGFNLPHLPSDAGIRDVPCQTAMAHVGQWFGHTGPCPASPASRPLT